MKHLTGLLSFVTTSVTIFTLIVGPYESAATFAATFIMGMIGFIAVAVSIVEKFDGSDLVRFSGVGTLAGISIGTTLGLVSETFLGF